MRTAKYHDYILWRVLLFVILVILAVFAYFKFVKVPCEHELGGLEKVDATCTEDGYSYKECTKCHEQLEKKVISATGHNSEKVSMENEKPHTLTEGGSYELVFCCSNCGEQVSKETVMVDGAHTVEIVETKENIVEATCTYDGSYELVKTCKGCNAEIERTTEEIPAPGHSAEIKKENVVESTCTTKGSYEEVKCCADCGYELNRETVITDTTEHDYGEYRLVYDYINGTVKLYVVCNNDGKTTIITEADGLEVTHLQEDVPACCGLKYTIKYTYGDFVVEETIEFEPAPHKVCYTIVDENGKLNHDNTYDLPEAEYDEAYGEYYDVDKCPGIIRGDYIDNPDLNKWDENGFAKGTFKCALCGQFYMVTIYSAEHDTRLK